MKERARITCKSTCTLTSQSLQDKTKDNKDNVCVVKIVLESSMSYR